MNRFALALLAAATLTACAETSTGPDTAERETTITRKAVVETVDLESRQVLLRGENGRMLSVTAGPDVRNLPQLESGDIVRLDYYEAVSVKMAAPSDDSTPTGTVAAIRTPEGSKPGAGVGRAISMVVEFISYDPETTIATFTTPDGTVQNVKVKPQMRDFASTRKSGDRIDLTMTQALAVSIEETD